MYPFPVKPFLDNRLCEHVMAGDVPTGKRAVLLAIFIAFGECDDVYQYNESHQLTERL